MITVVDYGVGNLFSIARSIEYLGHECALSRDPDEIYRADKILLPGVGAFGDAMKKLKSVNLDEPLIEKAKSGAFILGICLGMQLLFDQSHEYGLHAGLGLIPGDIVPLEVSLKVPQIGWNQLEIKRRHPLVSWTNNGDYVYYVHSYYASTSDEYIVAASRYGVDVPGVVARENVMGTQFHPEKSGAVGLRMLDQFAKL